MSDGEAVLLPLLVQFILIIINAVFACAEIAVISMNDNRLAKLTAAGDRRAIRLSKLTEQPARFLATIQVGITLAGFLASAFAANSFSDRLASLMVDIGIRLPISTLDTISVVAITFILSYFTLVLGELVPKRVAMRNADRLALAMSGLVSFIAKVFAPLVWFLTLSTNGVLQLFGIDPQAADDDITEEEIRMMVDRGSEKGAINHTEKEMIQNVFEFDDKDAEDVMIHRTEVSILWLDESIDQWKKTIIESRHSVFPVCDETTDNVVGILKAKDFFGAKDKTLENIIRNALKPAYFVPETVRTDVLFRNMKKTRNHFAIVLDDYGGMSGIITMNDLLEELVGDLEDDDTIPEKPPLIEPIDSQTWKIHGLTPLETVSERLGVILPEEDYDTFGGLVFGLLGFIPEDGSTPELEGFGLSIKVTEIKDHQLERAIVCVVQQDRKNGNGSVPDR
ncbi:MAG: hemolysin family protein [Firmicutes bacterium]|nr:hemolysin family protein [Bacillota bacterium]MDD3297927.1 hemolysin family protein [Bacillota bacterium]MDD3850585.1 hemolysin family protein [Bacillota bacterium]MDD4707373.1 hemolysin family protein [Bacillota bacterium]